jgi:TRAP-type C4-dicarboxylate transport system substrate-binding protein
MIAAAAIGALAVAAVLSACGAGARGGAAYTIKLATPTGTDTPIGQAAAFWAKAVEEESNGKVKVELFQAGSLVPGTEILKATQDSRVGVGIVPNAYHPKELAALSVVATPYVTQKTVVDIAALNDLAKSNKTLSSEFVRLGLKPLFFVGNGAAAMVSKAPIRNLDDIRGKRLRALATTETMVKPLGATGSFVEFADVYESIERGVLDGAFPMDMGSAAGASLNEVASHFTVTGQGTYTVSAGLMSQGTYDTYPQDVKDAIGAANERYNKWVPKAFAEFEAGVCDKLIKRGTDVTVLPEAEVLKWRRLAEGPLNDHLVKTARSANISEADFVALQDDYRAKAAKYEKSTDYVDGMTACAARGK